MVTRRMPWVKLPAGFSQLKFEWVRRLGGYGAELWERCWGLTTDR